MQVVELRAFEFRRVSDGMVYRFEPVTGEPGRWKRTDIHVVCERREGRWVVVDIGGAVTGWPVASDGSGDAPPAGRWRSAKGGKSYEYELVWV